MTYSTCSIDCALKKTVSLCIYWLYFATKTTGCVQVGCGPLWRNADCHFCGLSLHTLGGVCPVSVLRRSAGQHSFLSLPCRASSRLTGDAHTPLAVHRGEWTRQVKIPATDKMNYRGQQALDHKVAQFVRKRILFLRYVEPRPEVHEEKQARVAGEYPGGSLVIPRRWFLLVIPRQWFLISNFPVVIPR